MKFLASSLFFAIALTARAADNQELAESFLELSGTREAMEQGFDIGFAPALKQMESSGVPAAAIAEIKVEAGKFFQEALRWEDVKPEIAALYAREFTEPEMEALIEFYSTPVGKKSIEKMPLLMQEGAQIGMRRVNAKLPEFQQRVQAILEKHQTSKSGDTAP